MKKSVIREYAESLIIAVILALFVRTWVFQAFKIPTGSMEPNLLVGDHLIVNRMVFAPAVTGVERAILPGRTIRRGDVVYEDGSQRSNRKVPRTLTGGLDGDKPAHEFLIEQDRDIAEKSGRPPLRIKSISRAGAKKKDRDYSERRVD